MVGDMIKKARKDNGITQIALAEASDITQTYLSQIENNTKIPSIEVLKKIAFAMDFDLTISFTPKQQDK